MVLVRHVRLRLDMLFRLKMGSADFDHFLNAALKETSSRGDTRSAGEFGVKVSYFASAEHIEVA